MFSFLIQNQNKGKRFVTPPFPAFFRQGAGGRLARTARKALAFIGYRSQSHPVGDLRKLCKKRGFRKIPLRGGPHPATRMLSHVFSSGGGRGTVRACRAKGPPPSPPTPPASPIEPERDEVWCGVVFTLNEAVRVVKQARRGKASPCSRPGGRVSLSQDRSIRVKEGWGFGGGGNTRVSNPYGSPAPNFPQTFPTFPHTAQHLPSLAHGIKKSF